MGVAPRLRLCFHLILFAVLRAALCFRDATPAVLHTLRAFPGATRFCVLAKRRKSARILITLECTEARKLGMRPSRYYTSKNKVNTPERLELMKYNKFLRRHTLHKEIK